MREAPTRKPGFPALSRCPASWKQALPSSRRRILRLDGRRTSLKLNRQPVMKSGISCKKSPHRDKRVMRRQKWIVATITLVGSLLISGCVMMKRSNQTKGSFCLVIHGGAGVITRTELPPEKEAQYRAVLEQSLRAGFHILETNGTSLDAVTAAVRVMEDSPLFNAGKGAVLNHEGIAELDAAVMEGATLRAGAVAGA